MNSRASGRAIGGSPVFISSFTRGLPLRLWPLSASAVQPNEIRVALVSGNYNGVRDGANGALNRLVDYLLRQGVHVRVYSPSVANPAFPATGDLVDVPAIPIPGRS